MNIILIFFRYHSGDVDSQSDAGSERSVTPVFIPPNTSQQPHPAHLNQSQPTTSIPYHMHHSLIQHLTDMRDLYGNHIGINNHHSN